MGGDVSANIRGGDVSTNEPKFNEGASASSVEKRSTVLANSSILAHNFLLLAFIAYSS